MFLDETKSCKRILFRFTRLLFRATLLLFFRLLRYTKTGLLCQLLPSLTLTYAYRNLLKIKPGTGHIINFDESMIFRFDESSKSWTFSTQFKNRCYLEKIRRKIWKLVVLPPPFENVRFHGRGGKTTWLVRIAGDSWYFLGKNPKKIKSSLTVDVQLFYPHPSYFYLSNKIFRTKEFSYTKRLVHHSTGGG